MQKYPNAMARIGMEKRPFPLCTSFPKINTARGMLRNISVLVHVNEVINRAMHNRIAWATAFWFESMARRIERPDNKELDQLKASE